MSQVTIAFSPQPVPLIEEAQPITPIISGYNTDAQLADQGNTFNQAGHTFNQAGDIFGGVYNRNQDIFPYTLTFDDIGSSQVVPIQLPAGMPMGLLLDLTYPVTVIV